MAKAGQHNLQPENKTSLSNRHSQD